MQYTPLQAVRLADATGADKALQAAAVAAARASERACCGAGRFLPAHAFPALQVALVMLEAVMGSMATSIVACLVCVGLRWSSYGRLRSRVLYGCSPTTRIRAWWRVTGEAGLIALQLPSLTLFQASAHKEPSFPGSTLVAFFLFAHAACSCPDLAGADRLGRLSSAQAPHPLRQSRVQTD